MWLLAGTTRQAPTPSPSGSSTHLFGARRGFFARGGRGGVLAFFAKNAGRGGGLSATWGGGELWTTGVGGGLWATGLGGRLWATGLGGGLWTTGLGGGL
jgi:hypothetical protein